MNHKPAFFILTLVLIGFVSGCIDTRYSILDTHGNSRNGKNKVQSTIFPDDMRCEYSVNPAGVDAVLPHLSWIIKAGEPSRRGLFQTAYQVLVASSDELLAKDKGNLWDSGKVESDESLHVAYAGSPLLLRQRCCWKVRLWDQAGRVSDWSRPAVWTMGLLQRQDWKAQWIQAEKTDALPIFRKGFVVRKEVHRAELYICGLGAFEVRLDGQVVCDDVLEPGWTNYRKSCLYRVFDLTSKIKEGPHVLGVMLGNSMYNVTPGRYSKFTGSFGPPKLIAQLYLGYTDGTGECVGSDASWKATSGPITFSSIYGGEDYDARREPTDWECVGFDDSGWAGAVETDGPGGKLVGLTRSAPPVRAAKVLLPQKVTNPQPGVWVYDLGQNCSLMPYLTVKGPAGAEVRITPGELLNSKGTVSQQSSGGPSYLTYTLRGGAEETWSPRFFYYGARYLQVTGAAPAGQTASSGEAVVEHIEGHFVCGSSRITGEFACSNELFNRTARLIEWAIRSNMMSIFTDCPHREKLGWLEQIHLMGPSFMYSHDVALLLRKMVGDMTEAQTETGLVPDIAPEYTVFKEGFRDSPEWGSAYVIVPWNLYLWYGDISILRDHYEGMKRYAAYLAGRAQEHLIDYGLGDWYDIGPNRPGQAQLTPRALTATAFYYRDIAILEQAAQLLGRSDDVQTYARLRREIGEAFNRAFYNPQTHQYSTGSQTANAIPLVFGLVSAGETTVVMENIVNEISRRGNSLTAGDIGYRYLLRALAEGGRSDVIFEMNIRSDRPGYGYQLAQGATSLTEAWNADRRSSQNHFMLGHILEWFYADLAGIQAEPNAIAFKRICIRPSPVGDVTWAKAGYDSPRGRIISSWKRQDGKFSLDVTIPPNTNATIYIPAKDASFVTEGGKSLGKDESVILLGAEGRMVVCKVSSGQYQFESREQGIRR